MSRRFVAASLVAASLVVVQPFSAARQAPSPPPASAEEAWRSNNVGVAYLEQFKPDEAARNFRRALELDPSLSLARINLAIALFYVPDLPEALKAAEAAADIAPGAPQPPFILGLIAKADNRVDAAVAAFGRVLTLDPGDLGARVNLAQLHMQKREYAAAVDLLRPAVAAEPYHVTALYNLGVALTRAGQADAGQQVMAQFQKLREGGYGTTFSNNYLEQGRYAEAVASTGAEPGLVADTADLRFTRAATLPRAVADPALNPDPVHTRALADLGGGFALVDLDRDGDLDLVDVSAFMVRLFRNDAGTFTDITAKAGPVQLAPKGAPVAVVAADYDNDEKVDLFVLGVGAHRLLRQTGTGAFEDATATAGIPATPGVHRAAAFVDTDHDGDVDLFLAATLGSASHVLLRNNGNGTFTDASGEARLAAVTPGALAVVPTDYDNRRDVDLLVAGRAAAPALLKNLRDGSFRDVASELGLAAIGAATAVAAGDVNKDGFTDFFFGRVQAGVLAASDGRGGFRTTDLPDLSGVTAAQLVDVDNDGLLDIVATTAAGPVIKRALGQRRAGDATSAAWAPATAPGLDGIAATAFAAVGAFAAGDLDQDGDTDLLMKTAAGELAVLRNESGTRHGSIAVRLDGRVSNRSAIGSKVELRAGSLRQKLETASAWPASAPADLVFGLGPRAGADVVRVLWPAGILQAELPEAPATRPGPRPVHQRLALTELDRKPSSCPYLFTWNGQRFEFITDFMGGGEMGYLHAPGIVSTPDPEEYTRIDGTQLRPRDGRFELRITNELEETLFLDRLQLLVVDHPADVEAHPREGLVSPPFPGFELYTAADIRPVARAIDTQGRDVTHRTRALDRQFVDNLPLERIRGYAKPHTLTLDLGAAAGPAGPAPTGPAPSERTLLLLTGWTDYAFSSDNIAAHQAGLPLTPPSLQVKDAAGAWQTVVTEIGVPVGRPQTVVVDLTNRFLSTSREVRISTSMRIYWDQIRVASARTDVTPRLTPLEAQTAHLRWRGFSAEVTPDGREPYRYDYARVTDQSPWKLLPGRYTREGDVRELLTAGDDFHVVSRPGDEIALSFDATRLPRLASGWTRTFLLHSLGYSKEMDRNSASPDQAWPLPFRTMTQYPYAAPERYPDTPAHRAYLERWNTRLVGRTFPPLELAAPGATPGGSR